MKRRIPEAVSQGYRCLPDKELVEPPGVESVPELYRFLHETGDVDISELITDFHIEQGY